ncbi:hypothetical protein ACFXA3_32165 [Streptomyces sp. NPDC059456]|uniref:hypothetical protein n=1 Tax=Streptomyces sp. NPDC059456 TaxID=3346838 RepID=UPI0036A711C1
MRMTSSCRWPPIGLGGEEDESQAEIGALLPSMGDAREARAANRTPGEFAIGEAERIMALGTTSREE